MKTRVLALAALVLVAVAALASACGGGDEGEEATIRTDKGLSVAALAAVAGGADGETEGQGVEAGVALGGPSADTAIGIGGGGVIVPDIAPFPFPSFQESQTGITVQGFGSATVDADGAALEFYFGSEFRDGIIPLPEPVPGQSEPGFEGSSSGSPEVQPLELTQEITEAELQPVVDAIVARGVSRADIEVNIEPFFGDIYFGGSATIRVTARNVDAVDAIADAATEAAAGLADISLQGTNVSYTVSDCAALELAAMQVAVEDARERGRTFAAALGVGLGAVEGASHYSYSPFGSPCDSSGFGGPYSLDGIAYTESQAMDVQLIATVTVTFAMQ